MLAVLLLAVGLCAIVVLPALTTSLWGDQRSYLYRSEAIAGPNPLRLVQAAWNEIPTYLNLGVFRPVSRFGFHLEHWITVRTAIATGISPLVIQAFVKIVAVTCLIAVALGAIGQYRRAGAVRPDNPLIRVLMVALAVGAAVSLVLYNPGRHPVTLYPGLYLGTAAVALAVPLLLGRRRLTESQEPAGNRWLTAVVLVGYAAGGAVLAGMIELAYLAIPLGIAHLVLLDVTAGHRWRSLPRRLVASGAFRRWLALTAGFLTVFVPTRIEIFLHCRDAVCYRANAVSVDAELLVAEPLRIVSGLFVVPQLAQGGEVLDSIANPGSWMWASLAAGLGAVAVLRVVALLRKQPEEPAQLRVRFWWALTGYFLTVVVLAALLSGLSQTIQDAGFPRAALPWRDTGFAWIGWTGLLAVAAALVFRWAVRRRAIPELLVLAVAFGLFSTATVNHQDIHRSETLPDVQLHIAVADTVADFELTPAADSHRCRIVQQLETLEADVLVGYLDRLSDNHHGTPYCSQR